MPLSAQFESRKPPCEISAALILHSCLQLLERSSCRPKSEGGGLNGAWKRSRRRQARAKRDSSTFVESRLGETMAPKGTQGTFTKILRLSLSLGVAWVLGIAASKTRAFTLSIFGCSSAQGHDHRRSRVVQCYYVQYALSVNNILLDP